eukprot:CAMPEP_0172595628 /NCGR_PEP_ID=MMETSP1068-20121228/15248_1 /TAXON_ID=35684 /ORGANISM="Pseudopedinella elastica, Strain CCMP716" /LENGTH=102 /DNA_ID=CAMNT_0013394251 /DNA_START=30 /DNA_END=338 /DNA_ORIENTATION=+
MGNSLAVTLDPFSEGSAAANAKDRVAVCKRQLGLGIRDPYPRAYRGECDDLELELKKALSFAIDPRNAKALYDPNSARSARLAANKALQPQLNKHLSGRGYH